MESFDEGIVREITLKLRSTSKEGPSAIRCPAETTLTVEEEDALLDTLLGPSVEEADDPGETFEMTTEGGLCDDGEKIALFYPESSLTGMAGALTVIEFDKKDPGLVTVLRRGTMQSTFVLEQGRTHMGLYELPEGRIDVSTGTRTLENHLSMDGGTLRLDYRIRLGGIATMDVKLDVEVLSIHPAEE